MATNLSFDIQRSLSCTTCGRAFKRKYHLDRHMLSHSDWKPFSCQVCGQGYKRREKLDRHLLKHLSNLPTMSFRCPSCDGTFLSQQLLHDHMKTHMKQEAEESGSASSSVGNDSNFACVCNVCGKSFSKKDHLKRHKAIHSDSRPFTCHICAMAFKRKDKLTSHLNSHGISNLLPCSICGKHFLNKQSLDIHMRKTHMSTDNAVVKEEVQRALANGKSFVCEFCYQGFTRKYHLDRHRAASHGGVKPHACPECGQGFTRKDHMERHLLTHLGLKPFSCSRCNKTFRRKETLAVHKASHDSNGQPPFPCLYCEQRFATPKSRAAHMQRHVDAHAERVASVMEIVVEEC